MLRHKVVDQGRIDTLRSLELFRSCSDHDIELLAAAIDEECTVPGGKLLCDQGKPAQCCFIILDGQAEVKMQGETVATVNPGQSIGERGVLGHVPRNAMVVAKDEVRVFRLDDTRLRKLAQTAPAVIAALQGEVERREAEIARATSNA
jgi:CRP-like cAMP-binding protein